MLKSSRSLFTKAAKRANQASKLIRERDTVGMDTKAGIALDKKIRRLIVSGYYEHFKSSQEKPMLYRVVKIYSHVNYKLDSHVYQVAYAAMYKPHDGVEGLRELLGPDGFLTPIHREEYVGPRFRYRGKTLKEAKRVSEYK